MPTRKKKQNVPIVKRNIKKRKNNKYQDLITRPKNIQIANLQSKGIRKVMLKILILMLVSIIRKV